MYAHTGQPQQQLPQTVQQHPQEMPVAQQQPGQLLQQLQTEAQQQQWRPMQ